MSKLSIPKFASLKELKHWVKAHGNADLDVVQFKAEMVRLSKTPKIAAKPKSKATVKPKGKLVAVPEPEITIKPKPRKASKKEATK